MSKLIIMTSGFVLYFVKGIFSTAKYGASFFCGRNETN